MIHKTITYIAILLTIICLQLAVIMHLLGSIQASFERDYSDRLTAIYHQQYDVQAHGPVYLPDEITDAGL